MQIQVNMRVQFKFNAKFREIVVYLISRIIFFFTDGKITQEEFIRACLDQESALSTMLALKVIDVFI